MKIHGRVFPSGRTRYLKGKFGRDHPMKRHIVINGRDEALFDQNGAIILHSSDQRSKVEMSPRIVCEEMCCFLTFVGSSLCDLD